LGASGNLSQQRREIKTLPKAANKVIREIEATQGKQLANAEAKRRNTATEDFFLKKEDTCSEEKGCVNEERLER